MLALAGSVAILAFLVALVDRLVRQQWREGGLALLPLLLLVLAGVTAAYDPRIHTLVALLTLVAALWNTVRLSGIARVASFLGAAGCAAAITAATLLFR